MKAPLAKWSTCFVSTTANIATSAYIGGVLEMPEDIIGGVFIAQIVGTATHAHTLDLAYCVTPDDGTTYFPVLRHAQVATTGNRYLNVSFQPFLTAGTEGAAALTGGALCVNTAFTRKFKIYATVGGTSPEFTVAIYFVGWRAKGVPS
jgi:hypothetical protein